MLWDMNRTRPADRALVLIDIENLALTSRPSEADGWKVMQSLRATFPILPTDHVVVASPPGNATCASVLQRELGALLKVRRGADGADLALLEEADSFLEQDSKRFRYTVTQLVICSGDGAFAGLARAFRRDRGPGVTVISQRSALNWALACEATDLRVIPLRPKFGVAA